MNHRIYFICPTNKSVTGGVKQIYKQVEILRRNGFDAVLLLKKKGKESWFESNVVIESNPYIFKKIKYSYQNKKISFWHKILLRILRLRSKPLQKDSILVFPEIYGPRICHIEPLHKKVIFNQNCYYTFEHYQMNEDLSRIPYKGIMATICVSADSEKYLKTAFPETPVFRIHLGIDEKIFEFSSAKKKQIAFMPRKLSQDAVQIINILRNRKNIEGWDFVAIDNKTEREVANILKESAIFLSFNHQEGFGLPPAEAMSCGCYVIGYRGQAGTEYFKDEFSTAISEGNIIDFVKSVEEIAGEFQTFQDKGIIASQFIKSHYNLQIEETDILRTWKSVLNLS
ncbi:glycosyltransferase [Chryseobacterium koreense]|uniref:Glycosyl transferase family 1 domain-containing protein n=1 Tax=Chryseobacterium koreense CCUG 49689 TaxID=1304281 RepID=A0A0J7LPQ9_9FLAO|nr:glycosyltransferase [Chryseobacterium koreense]KMQ71050.1 hypothetical protein ACM44_08875 [Chryseobacterium koreense CCUG 49689]MBB5332864.1 glycosyltransferase involved in cell wall biosynthesis [Chryseobacterium koreense]